MSEDPTKRFPEASDDKIDRLVKTVEALSNEVSTLRSELSALSETVEHRLHDTRPMWEAVLAEMENLKSQVSALENRVGSLETTVHNDVKDLAYVVRGQYLDVIRVQRDLEERVTALEQK